MNDSDRIIREFDLCRECYVLAGHVHREHEGEHVPFRVLDKLRP